MEAINAIAQLFSGLSEGTQVGIIMVALVALVSGGGLWQALRRRSPAREREFRRTPPTVRLSEADRVRLDRLGENVGRLGSAIEKHGEEVRRHGDVLPRGPGRGTRK